MSDYVTLSGDAKARVIALVAKFRTPIGETGTTATTIVEIVDAPKQPQIITEYIYDTKYISGEALNKFITFTDRNQYIIKSGTGAGGTSAMLNQTNTNVIIVSPNRSQVEGKEAQKATYGCQHCFFVYGGSTDRWKQIELYLRLYKNVVVMTTPDSFFLLKQNNSELYEYLKDTHLLIDEYHQVVKDDYREIMEQLYTEVKSWRATIKFSTATPQPYLLDLITDMNIETLKVISKDKQDQRVFYSEDKNDYKRFVSEHLTYDEPVVVFTNDSGIYDALNNEYGQEGIVHNATGKSLGISTGRYSVDNDDVRSLMQAIEDGEKKLFILSSAFFAGFDFTKVANVCVVSDQMNSAFMLDWLDVVQALGRLRHGYLDILLINAPHSIKTGKQRQGSKWVEYEPIVTEQILNQRLSLIGNGDDIYSVRQRLEAHNQFFTQNPEARQLIFSEYGYHLEPFVIRSDIPKFGKTSYAEHILNLMRFGEDKLLMVLKGEGKYKLRNEFTENGVTHDVGNVSHKCVMEYYTAYIIIKYDLTMFTQLLTADDGSLKAKDFCTLVRDFLLDYLDPAVSKYGRSLEQYILPLPVTPRADIIEDYLLLYTGCGFEEETYSEAVERQISISSIMNNRVELYRYYTAVKTTEKNCNNTRLQRCRRWIKTELTKLGIELDDKEKEYMELTMTRAFHEFRVMDDLNSSMSHVDNFVRKEPINYNTRETLLKKIRKVCMFIYAENRGTMKEITRDSRKYSPLTLLPRNLRIAIPIKTIVYDIKSANPSIICKKLLKMPEIIPIYHNLCRKLNITFSAAKVEFNSILNNHKKSYSDAKAFYMSCGFDADQANIIAKLSAGVERGSMFQLMTFYEAEVVFEFTEEANETYAPYITAETFLRLHDSVIIRKSIAKDLEFQREFDGILFGCEEF